MANLYVVAGLGTNKQVVGSIPASDGVLTNRGRVQRVTDKGTVFLENGESYRRLQAESDLTVRHSEAVKHGYPHANGCVRSVVREIRRAGQLIEA